jgi:hypothetical protein
MSDISEIVHEIERHKGVLLPDPQEMGIFSYKLFTGAHDQLGHTSKDYEGLTQVFVEQRYNMVLEHCKQMYWDNPEAREFFYTVDWDDL